MMTRIRSFIPRDEMMSLGVPPLPCVWCGEGTAVKAETPFRPDLGSVPLHLTCGAEIIRAYQEWIETGAIPDEVTRRRMHALAELRP